MQIRARHLAWFPLLVALAQAANGQSGWYRPTSPSIRPGASTGHLFAYDSNHHFAVLFGGHNGLYHVDETWLWNGTAWQQNLLRPAPSARSVGAYCYDDARGRIVMFGGMDPQYAGLNDTWEFTGTRWVACYPLNAPSARWSAAMAFDALQRSVLFGGNGLDDDTWLWDGADWSLAQPTQRPSGRAYHVMTTDHKRRRVLLLGGIDSWSNWADPWEWDGVNWRRVSTAGGPTPETGYALACGNGDVVRFGGSTPSTFSDETWLFAGNDWIQDQNAAHPSVRTGPQFTYDTDHHVFLMWGGFWIDRPNWSWLYYYPELWQYTPPSVATLVPFGEPCAGSAGAPILQTRNYGRPVLGATMTLEVLGTPPSTPVAFLFGTSDRRWARGGLPFPLDGLGMPGCRLFASPDDALFVGATQQTAQLAIGLPNSPALVGKEVFIQSVVADSTANAAGSTVTNALAARIGTL